MEEDRREVAESGTSATGKGRVIAGWVLFGIALAVYIVVTAYFGVGFTQAVAKAASDDGIELALMKVIFLIFGTLLYLVAFFLSLVGTLVANIKRGGWRLQIAPIISLGLSVVTYVAFIVVILVG